MKSHGFSKVEPASPVLCPLKADSSFKPDPFIGDRASFSGFGDFVTDQMRSLSREWKSWLWLLLLPLFLSLFYYTIYYFIISLLIIIIFLSLLSWLLTGATFLTNVCKMSLFPLLFSSLFSESHQLGLVYPGWGRMLAWINPWSSSYSASFGTCRARWGLCALTFPLLFHSGTLSRHFSYCTAWPGNTGDFS